jgi:hypothetical protein
MPSGVCESYCLHDDRKLIHRLRILLSFSWSHVVRWRAAPTSGPRMMWVRAWLTPLQYKVTQEDGTEPHQKHLLGQQSISLTSPVVSGEPPSPKDSHKSGTELAQAQ